MKQHSLLVILMLLLACTPAFAGTTADSPQCLGPPNSMDDLYPTAHFTGPQAQFHAGNSCFVNNSTMTLTMTLTTLTPFDDLHRTNAYSSVAKDDYWWTKRAGEDRSIYVGSTIASSDLILASPFFNDFPAPDLRRGTANMTVGPDRPAYVECRVISDIVGVQVNLNTMTIWVISDTSTTMMVVGTDIQDDHSFMFV